jgi:hypothetical protein
VSSRGNVGPSLVYCSKIYRFSDPPSSDLPLAPLKKRNSGGRILCVYLNCLLRINSLAFVFHVMLFSKRWAWLCYKMTSQGSHSERVFPKEAKDEETGMTSPNGFTSCNIRSLTAWIRAFLEKLVFPQIIKKLLAIYE